jgi:hypothetical protein
LVENKPSVFDEEKNYRASFVDPFTTAVKKYIDAEVIFNTAETTLKAMSFYLKNNDLIKCDRENYKADGTLEYKGIEIMLTEISGPFMNTRRSKYTFDIHKAMFGCLSMLRFLCENYEFASLETLEKMKVYFLHTKGNAMSIS